MTQTRFQARHTRTSGGLPSLRPVVLPLSGLLIAQFTLMLSGTVVATALPTLMTSLEGPRAHAPWIVAATVLASAATTPIWGKLTDRTNPKKILLISLALFLTTSLAAGFSGNTAVLLLFRALQGVSVGGLTASIAVVIAHLVSARQRGRVNGWLTIAQTTAMIAGPILGGVIVEAPALGWHWCFFLLSPTALLSMIVIARTLHITMPPLRRARLDLGGAFLIASGLVALLVGVTTLSQGADSLPLLVISLSYGVVALTAAIVVEWRADDPVLPLRLLANRIAVLSIIAAVLVGTTLFVGTVFVIQYLQLGLGFTATLSGLLQLPMAVMTIVSTLVAGRFMSATATVKPVLISGISSILAGSIVLVFINVAPVPFSIIGSVLVGIGLGAVMQNLVVAPQNSAPLQHVGSVTATVLFLFILGGSIGLIVFGAIADTLVEGSVRIGVPVSQAYLDAMPVVFLVSAAIVVPALVAVIALPKIHLNSGAETHTEPDAKPIV